MKPIIRNSPAHVHTNRIREVRKIVFICWPVTDQSRSPKVLVQSEAFMLFTTTAKQMDLVLNQYSSDFVWQKMTVIFYTNFWLCLGEVIPYNTYRTNFSSARHFKHQVLSLSSNWFSKYVGHHPWVKRASHFVGINPVLYHWGSLFHSREGWHDAPNKDFWFNDGHSLVPKPRPDCPDLQPMDNLTRQAASPTKPVVHPLDLYWSVYGMINSDHYQHVVTKI